MNTAGTDRAAEAVQILGAEEKDLIVNIQGDQPLFEPGMVDEIVGPFRNDPNLLMGALVYPIRTREELLNPSVVKVVRDAEGYALYFSRAAIPWPREIMAGKGGETIQAYRHIGLYAYRAGFVRRYAAWPPCPGSRSRSRAARSSASPAPMGPARPPCST